MPLQELTELCKSLAEVVTDQNFVSQVLAINDDIGNMSVSVENWQLKEPKDVAATETETKMETQAIKDTDNAAAT